VKMVSRKVSSSAFNSNFAVACINKSGQVDLEKFGKTFSLTLGQIAETAGLGEASIRKTDRRSAPKVQNRVREMIEILARVSDWAGNEHQAMAWYRSQPIPALDGRTPEALVQSGRAGALRDYLDHMALGGFA
jgi:uncharacterized protein (DUF2384 family)